ncbi:MAG: outer membrane protein assembly factor BamB [Bdellovibrionales bacterium]|nr:outer membrane protein assembly factor BamB [Ramlibacter sp.]
MTGALPRSLSRSVVLLATAVVLAACAGGSSKPKPVELAPNAALIGVRQAWTARVGEVGFPLSVGISGDTVVVAGAGGAVVALDGRSGRDLWRTNVGAPIVAGVGTDGKIAAVVTNANEVVAIDNGRELWRHKLVSQTYTAPFVAGGRVFVLVADRSVVALDGQTGRRLWLQQRPGEPLVLRQSGVMLSVGDTLVVGLSGRLVGLNPTSGAIRWEVPIAAPRGTNDVERLVDLVSRVSRNGDVVCARAFQANVGCVNAARGSLIWTKPANGSEGVHGDDRYVFGTESDGKVIAWRRTDGERAWVSDRLQYRGLSAPLSVGRSVAIGDNTGLVHLLSREDGSPLSRVATDGTAIVGSPVLAGDTLIVVTRAGGVFGFQPE